MTISTKAIVIHTLKFQESSLIIKCYTKTDGIKSYLLKGILSKRRNLKMSKAYFQLGSLIEIEANHNTKGTLNYIKEARSYQTLHNLQTNVYKSAIVVFLSEILTAILKEEEQNLTLFNFIESALIWLDKSNSFGNFPVLFLLQLTHYLGFYPQVNKQDTLCFDLSEGIFTNNKPISDYLIGRNLTLFKSIIGTNFDANLELNKTEKQTLLKILLKYFDLHLPSPTFRDKKPKSLYVLQAIFK